MGSSSPNDRFSEAAVAEQLRQQATPDGLVDAQIFFEIGSDALAETAARTIREAEHRLNRPGSVSIRKIHDRAMSVSVRGEVDVIAATQSDQRVKAVLPNVIPDILPKPVRRK